MQTAKARRRKERQSAKEKAGDEIHLRGGGKMQWEYATRIVEDDGDFVVTVRDLPEVQTSGDTREQAIELAADAIDVVLAHRIEEGLDLPAPSKAQRGEILIAPPLQTQAKAAVYAARPRSS
ncbi:MAG: type II toxin-antitoxin system HicB family antitoxin [Rhodoblastus sp.]